ncbi:hypothetical protein D6829_00310 [Candidatus Pacearchaeota archaeon]|nr:MAG: hypothetical protein D6829_00310 [Candidatus Pacearchaeota archaeon]
MAEKAKLIKSTLEHSQNPLFLFDNDVDGLCSFLVLRRSIGRGLGVPIKSFPELKSQYLKRIDELKPDVVVVLDKAEAEKEFLEGVLSRGIQLIWIDHHNSKTEKEISHSSIFLKSKEPTTYASYNIFGRKENLWIAVIGCISDVFMPDFAADFEKEYPELFNSKIGAFDALHSTEVGKIVQMLNFGLMDSTTNVVSLIKFLFKARGPYDILTETHRNKRLHFRYSQLKKFFDKQIEKAEKQLNDKDSVLIFTYSGSISMSSQIANALYFRHRDKLIVVAFKGEEKVNISLRGKNALKITKKIVSKIQGATGGGHPEATGAMVPLDSFEKFKELVKAKSNRKSF